VGDEVALVKLDGALETGAAGGFGGATASGGAATTGANGGAGGALILATGDCTAGGGGTLDFGGAGIISVAIGFAAGGAGTFAAGPGAAGAIVNSGTPASSPAE